MIQDFFAWLIATFVLAPIQAEIASKLQAAGAAPAIIRQAEACVSTAAPVLAERAGRDWVWAASTAIGAAVGVTDPKSVLVEASPACAAPVAALRPLTAG